MNVSDTSEDTCFSCGEPAGLSVGLMVLEDGRVQCTDCRAQEIIRSRTSICVVERDASTRGETIKSWVLKCEARVWKAFYNELLVSMEKAQKSGGVEKPILLTQGGKQRRRTPKEYSLGSLKKQAAKAKARYDLLTQLYVQEKSWAALHPEICA